MALYLGNQKVSLRSGQDPTFDYGFDSNGRLVFANKNATEINNFLNYDSSYSEILDLSNLSKMEKVAVNGTVDRKMEGLKGLLVSPNAPFTGSSPQINASYTGLNKSALVSLFESTPYNVGYTKVGSPTIVNGVASGFSSSDYLKISQNIQSSSITSSLQVFTKFTTGSSINEEMGICGNPNYFSSNGIFISSGKLYGRTRISMNGNTVPWTINTESFLSANTTYYAYTFLDIPNKTFSLNVSIDQLNWTTVSETKTDTFTAAQGLYGYEFGETQHGAFNGSIDLNETYIKVNGVPWFGPGVTKNLVPDGTVVGDVTVKDGIASGFSSSKYIRASNFSTASPLEMVIRTKYNTFKSGVRYLFSFAGLYILQDSANTIYCSIQKSDGTLVYPSFQNLVSDTFYYLKLVYDGATLWAGTSTDGITYTETYNQTLSLYSRTGTANLGYRNSGTTVWDGSIDLNNTYIKSGDTYIYRGMVPMTKTCSIVGATGTSDLTQEDKNIILNKGWSLTVQ